MPRPWPAALAKLIDIRRFGKTDIHVGATPEVDAVLNAALEKYGAPADEQQESAQCEEILGFAHPVDVGLFEELDHAVSRFPSLDSTLFQFVPETKRVGSTGTA